MSQEPNVVQSRAEEANAAQSFSKVTLFIGIADWRGVMCNVVLCNQLRTITCPKSVTIPTLRGINVGTSESALCYGRNTQYAKTACQLIEGKTGFEWVLRPMGGALELIASSNDSCDNNRSSRYFLEPKTRY